MGDLVSGGDALPDKLVIVFNTNDRGISFICLPHLVTIFWIEFIRQLLSGTRECLICITGLGSTQPPQLSIQLSVLERIGIRVVAVSRGNKFEPRLLGDRNNVFINFVLLRGLAPLQLSKKVLTENALKLLDRFLHCHLDCLVSEVSTHPIVL